MFILLKNAECYTPDYSGEKDILVVMDKIYLIEDRINESFLPGMQVIDCSGKIAMPGIIDQHVHLTGGGGEAGPASCIPELMLSELISGGISTVVGVLGMDGVARNIQGLLAKARALEIEGLNTFIYTGYYGVPVLTLTGRVMTDIAFIDKIIGAGEVAISDYRSSHPSIQQLKELSFEVLSGRMLGGKAGVLHIHVGDGKSGLQPLFDLYGESEFPIGMFVPTHINRSRTLFEQGMEYLKNGGNIDLTAGEKTGKGLSVQDGLKKLNDAGIGMDRVTVSSDGNGSMTGSGSSGETGKVSQLFNDIRTSILETKIPITTAIKTVTSNVAGILGMYPGKGCLAAGSDADILVVNREGFTLDKLLVRGQVLVDNGNPLVKGRFELRHQSPTS
ncbi:MAG: beta-aspartyl-peptidase [Ruminiclostridium sp.]|nr:beta-aspartyl-peptidase [Ruminiclostridium sp.]